MLWTYYSLYRDTSLLCEQLVKQGSASMEAAVSVLLGAVFPPLYECSTAKDWM